MKQIMRFIALTAIAVIASGSLGIYFQDNTQFAQGATDSMTLITTQITTALP